MAKRIFALLVFLSAGAQAHELTTRTDGCVVLEQIIYEEVTAAAWGMAGADLALTQTNDPGVFMCTRTARTVSKAFTTAMQTLGTNVDWILPIDPEMEECLKGFIEECKFTNPVLPIFELDDTFLVSSSWKAVRDTAMHAMPEGSLTDRSIFSAGSMRLALRTALGGTH